MLEECDGGSGVCHTFAAFFREDAVDRFVMTRWPSWSRSFYWRIAVSFVVLVIGVLVAQSLVFSYMMARSSPTFLSPNILALTVAADVQDVLERDPSIDLPRRTVSSAPDREPCGHRQPRACLSRQGKDAGAADRESRARLRRRVPFRVSDRSHGDPTATLWTASAFPQKAHCTPTQP
jgi:hypothetical protein